MDGVQGREVTHQGEALSQEFLGPIDVAHGRQHARGQTFPEVDGVEGRLLGVQGM